MLKDLRNDVITGYKIISRTRVKPKGVELPSKAKVDEILTHTEKVKIVLISMADI